MLIPLYVVHLDEADEALFNYATQKLNILGTPTVIRFNDAGAQNLEGRTAPVLIKEITNG